MPGRGSAITTLHERFSYMIEELIMRTLCDNLPDTQVDGVFMFAQTEDNQESVFRTGQRLLEQGTTNKLLFIQTPPISGYLGFEEWKKTLQNKGVGEDVIEPVTSVPAATQILHTGIEAESLATHAKERGYGSVIVVASPFQQPRAFMAAVTAAKRIYPELHLYSYPGKALSWTKEVAHSQGKVHDTRAGLIEGELERIKKYHAKGDLLAVREVLTYLNSRGK